MGVKLLSNPPSKNKYRKYVVGSVNVSNYTVDGGQSTWGVKAIISGLSFVPKWIVLRGNISGFYSDSTYGTENFVLSGDTKLNGYIDNTKFAPQNVRAYSYNVPVAVGSVIVGNTLEIDLISTLNNVGSGIQYAQSSFTFEVYGE